MLESDSGHSYFFLRTIKGCLYGQVIQAMLLKQVEVTREGIRERVWQSSEIHVAIKVLDKVNTKLFFHENRLNLM